MCSFILLCCGCGILAEKTKYDASEISQISFVTVDSGGEIREVEVLPQESVVPLLEDFSKLKCFEYWNDPIDYVLGSAILITFEDGNYHLINSYCTISHIDGKSNDTRQYYSKEGFIELWNQYCSHEYHLP